MFDFTRSPVALAILVSTLAGCGNSSEDVAEQADVNASAVEPVVSGTLANDESVNDSSESQAADNQASTDLPYPIYPNGTQYRTGGENGMTIVLFQTEDSFDEVDAYYEETSNMPRLSAMNDYVRYSVNGEDDDPWATDEPGIVIHKFNDESERKAVGADDNALTNIIMSY